MKSKTKTRIFNNAILRFGMKTKMRSVSSIVLIGIVSIVAALSVSITIITVNNLPRYMQGDRSDVGVSLFFVISIIHCLFAAFLTPAAAGSSMSSEREKQTMDVLLCSQMTPKEIVMGKYLSSVSWAVMISVVLLPAYAVMLLLGGVPLIAIIWAFFFIIWMTCVIASFAVFFSAAIKRSSAATVLTIAVLIGIMVITLWLMTVHTEIVYALNYKGISNFYTNMMPPSLYFNPLVTFGLLEYGVIYGFDTGNFIFNFNEWEYFIMPVFDIVIYTLLAFILLKVAVKKVDPMYNKLTKEEKKIKKSLKKGNYNA